MGLVSFTATRSARASGSTVGSGSNSRTPGIRSRTPTDELTCDGVDEAAASACLEALEQDGWEGPGGYFKDVAWQGKTWRAYLSLHETSGSRSTFTGSLSSN